MAARLALNLHPPRTGARPLNPARDLGAVADLLETVFADDLDPGGRQMIREARSLARSGLMLHLISPWSSAAGSLFPGIIWEESGRVVGNVTVGNSARRPGNWQVANVAVHPDFRGQGIGRRLMEATIDQVLNRSGRQISLQVRDTNPAVALYQRMGFRPLGSVTRWISTGRPRLGALHTSGSPVRPAQSKDWLALWQLFRSVTVAAQGWPDPLTMPHFRPRWWRSLLQLLNDETMRRWVAPAPFDGILDGYVELHGIAGRYRLTLRVRTGAVGQVEGDLLQEALSAVDRAGDGTVVIDHPSEEKTAEERFREAGFRADRTLILMQLQLKPQGGDSDGNI